MVCGKLFPRDDPAVSQAAFEQLASVLPGTAMLKSPLPAPSAIYAALFNRLVVFDDINLAGLGPYDWAPVTLDKGKPGNTLNEWLGLPWGGPDEVILPGFHTAAEDSSLKGMNKSLPGHEVFLSVCGLMANGSRTVLLSRWRSGGQTSYDIVREFTQELPHIAPAEAWQRAVFLTAGSQLNLAAEPRVPANAAPPPRKHPRPTIRSSGPATCSSIRASRRTRSEGRATRPSSRSNPTADRTPSPMPVSRVPSSS